MQGEIVGHYRISHPLGIGGMGVVYLAQDTLLSRPVALKMLLGPAAHSDLRESLLREGRAAAALSHPNICTVYEVADDDGRAFIVMEYVEGSSLASAIPAEGLQPESVLRYGMQIADALGHAHERRVIHADLKAANVMVTPEGRVKVLDFGIARRALDRFRAVTTETALEPDTRKIAGTVPYMAPEILTGQTPDVGSDIWSLGALLYEISSGKPPFSGASMFELTGAILRDPPAPLPPHVSPGLRAIILRCLAKEPGQRYRRAGEVRAALEAVDSGVRIASMAAKVPRPPYYRRTPIIAGALAVAIPCVALVWWNFMAPPGGDGDGGRRLVQVLSSEQRTFDPVISPDGRMIAYVAETAEGRVDLFLSDARGEGRVRLTDDEAREQKPRFSPDGRRLAFARRQPEGTGSDICIIPVLGGHVVPVVARAGFPAWSPDGLRLVFVHRPRPAEPVVLATANADGSDLKILFAADGAFPFMRAPAWSPDGREIAFINGSGGFAGEVWTIPVAGGAPRRLSNDPAAVFSDEPVFTPDGRNIVHSSNRGGATNIWLLPRSGAAPVRLTTGPGPDESPSIALDDTIVFSNTRGRRTLVVHAPATASTRSLLTHSAFLWGPAFSPDGGEIAYSQSEEDGSWRIWVVPTAGGAPRRLTSSPHGALYPRYTPDGSAIVYHNWNEPRRIWRIPRASGPPMLLPIDQRPGDAFADVSPDGAQVAFVRRERQAEYVYVASLGGGSARLLLAAPASVPRWSPDGRWIAFSPDRGYDAGVFVVRSDGTERRRVTERGGWPIWWPRGEQIAYLVVGPDGNQIVQVVSLTGGASRRLDALRFNGYNYAIAISPDGALIASSDAAHVSGDIWLLAPASTSR